VESNPASTGAQLPAPLAINLESDGDGTVRATISGQIDRAGTPAIRGCLAQAKARHGPRDMILDLRGVEFIDSSGLHMLLQTHQELHGEQSMLVLLAPEEPVRGLLALTGLDRYLTVVDSLPQAMALLAERGTGEGRAQAP
jgi:anti-sigma B factor antagonist